MADTTTLTTNEVIASRTHQTLDIRHHQLHLNMLVKNGGRPYIDARLQRAPNESDRSWNGSITDGIVGRKQRAFQINDAGRVPRKINDFLFAEDAKRDGIDEEWSKDVTASGLSVRQFWQEVSAQLTCGQWVWVQVDRGAPATDPETGEATQRSMLQREQDGDRVYWSVWDSTEVVDWCFGSDGALLWLITEHAEYENSDPAVAAETKTIRTLWKRGEYFKYDTSNGAELVDYGTISATVVPFVCIGIPTTSPWWFDDAEAVQCALLNLESLNYENLTQSVYPQLVIPASMVEELTSRLLDRYENGEQVQEVVRELVRGLEYPFTETSEDSGLTRYLTPPAGDLKLVTDNQDRLRSAMFDMVGLSLFTQESRQIQSAESKQWDHLDVNATLKNRALLMQDGERRAVDMSKLIDTTFEIYEPVWPQKFAVPNTVEDAEALAKLTNITDLTPALKRQLCKTVVGLLDQIQHIPPEQMKDIMDEIDEHDFDAMSGLELLAGNVPAVEQSATDDE